MEPNVIPIDQAATATGDSAAEAPSRKTEQNRRNALKSTGPKTEAGKKRSSLNALKHGLTGHTVVMPNENMQAFKEFSGAICAVHKPVGAYEMTLAQKAAELQWRMNRAGSVEANLFSLGHERNARRFAVDDNDRASTDIQAGFAQAFTFREETNTFLNIALYEQRLLKVYKSAIEELKRAQAERLERFEREKPKMTQIRKVHKQQNKPFYPERFGFVSPACMLEKEVRKTRALEGRLGPELGSENKRNG